MTLQPSSLYLQEHAHFLLSGTISAILKWCYTTVFSFCWNVVVVCVFVVGNIFGFVHTFTISHKPHVSCVYFVIHKCVWIVIDYWLFVYMICFYIIECNILLWILSDIQQFQDISWGVIRIYSKCKVPVWLILIWILSLNMQQRLLLWWFFNILSAYVIPQQYLRILARAFILYFLLNFLVEILIFVLCWT